jgi:hypothetical protein
MLRKILIGFAAAVLVGAAFVPDDALARGPRRSANARARRALTLKP